jgi:hypothetical protein
MNLGKVSSVAHAPRARVGSVQIGIPRPTKRCYHCKIDLTVDSFHKDASKSDGLQARCKRCSSEYQNAWLQRRRTTWLIENGPCRQCGSLDNLEVDHINPYTKTDHKVWSLSEPKRNAELAKCQVLCSSCHHKKTTAQSYIQRRHGTTNMRRLGGCFCTACKRAVADEKAYYRHMSKARTRKTT